MLPGVAQNYLGNSRLCDAKNLGERVLRFSSILAASDLKHLGLRKTGAWILFAWVFTGKVVSAFGYHVVHVVLLRAKKNVFGVATGGCIALVKCQKSIRDWAKAQFIRKAMYLDVFWAIMVQAVSIFVRWPLPQPTAIWGVFVDFFPEPIEKRALEVWVVTLDVFSLPTRTRWQWNILSTAALAELGEWEFGLKDVRGMIVHSNSLLTAVAHVLGCIQHRQDNFIGVLLDYFSTNGLITQGGI